MAKKRAAAERGGGRPKTKARMAKTKKPVASMVEPPSPQRSPRKSPRKSPPKSPERPAVPVVSPTRSEGGRSPKKTAGAPAVVAVEAEAEDSVVAEFPLHVLRCPAGSSLDRYAFEQPVPARMDVSGGRLKRAVKHVEFTYQTRRRADGVVANKAAAMFDGTYTGESFTKNDDTLREAVGFFQQDRFFLMPLNDSYVMQRKLLRPTDFDELSEQNRIADDALQLLPRPTIPQVVRVRYARQETEFQRRRREQSAYYRAMLFEQDPWVDCKVRREDVRSKMAAEIARAAASTTKGADGAAAV
ncbi:DNA-directed RNA polymerase III subunit Rpc5 family-containing protein [Aphelenchoides fujianensis]|nr:DNA-directed RNA polymerase III subunit Rpc5 family-containing protein [Aphelenchoides fujianensis]